MPRVIYPDAAKRYNSTEDIYFSLRRGVLGDERGKWRNGILQVGGRPLLFFAPSIEEVLEKGRSFHSTNRRYCRAIKVGFIVIMTGTSRIFCTSFLLTATCHANRPRDRGPFERGKKGGKESKARRKKTTSRAGELELLDYASLIYIDSYNRVRFCVSKSPTPATIL